MFGDLTTISLVVQERPERRVPQRARIDGVKSATTPRSTEEMESKSYSVGVSQIVTKNLVLSGQYEVITDEGWLNSPYRSVRFFIGTDQQGQQPEIYPNTRSSNAASIRAKYFLPYRAAIDAMYRFYTDTWGIVGHTAELGYVHPLDNAWVGGNWIFEGRVRYYTQTAADFYMDIFPRADFSNFMARDKELATYNAITAGAGRHLRIQDRALPLAHQGPGQSPLRPHDDQLRRLPRRALQPRKFRHVARRSRCRPAPSRCTSCDANIYQLFFSAFF